LKTTVLERFSVILYIISRLQAFLFLFCYGEHSSEEKKVKSSLNEGICNKSSKFFFTLCKTHLSICTILHSLEAATGFA